MFNYVQLSDSLSFFDGDSAITIDKPTYPTLFNQLSDALARNIDFEFDSHPLQSATDYSVTWRNNAYYYKNMRLTPSMSQRLSQLIDQGYDYTPILNFLTKLQSVDQKITADLQHLVASKEVALTYDGNIVLYKRASWNNNGQWHSVVTPGTVVTQNDEPLRLGSLDWIISLCPDQGVMSDVEVQPQHVLSVDYGIVKVSEYRFLSYVEEGYREVDKIHLVHTLTNSLGNEILVRLPYTEDNLQHYLMQMIHNRVSVAEPVVREFQSVGVSC